MYPTYVPIFWPYLTIKSWIYRPVPCEVSWNTPDTVYILLEYVIITTWYWFQKSSMIHMIYMYPAYVPIFWPYLTIKSWIYRLVPWVVSWNTPNTVYILLEYVIIVTWYWFQKSSMILHDIYVPHLCTYFLIIFYYKIMNISPSTLRSILKWFQHGIYPTEIPYNSNMMLVSKWSTEKCLNNMFS